MVGGHTAQNPEASDARITARPANKLRLLDLFSGIGGFSLGLESTGGFETVAFCEISPKCRFLLNHHWPTVPCFEDVRTLKGADVGEVDVICGGFPCQDISFAGRGAGIEGERSGLWREYARLIGELRPRFVIVENVSALLVRGMGTVLGDLAALGYGAWWDCIPASAVGAPHRRDRLWIVAHAQGAERNPGNDICRGQPHAGFGGALQRAIAAELAAADADRPEREACGSQSFGDGPSEARHRWSARDGACLADPARLQPGRAQQRPQRERVGASGESGDTSTDAPGSRRAIGWRERHAIDGEAGGAGESAPLRIHSRRPEGATWWLSEPDVGRVAHGVPARVDRLHGLANAVVPQIPALIGRAILSAHPRSLAA